MFVPLTNHFRFQIVLLLTCLAMLTVAPAQADAPQTEDAAFAAAVESLNARNFAKKGRAVQAFQEIRHPRAIPVLSAMLEGQLYYRKKDRRVVILDGDAEPLAIADAVTGETLGTVGKREVRRISVNNRLRRELRALIARLELGSEDASVRLAAARELVKTPDADNEPMLIEGIERETDERVREALVTALSLLHLEGDDRATRLDAIRNLEGSLAPEARSRLGALLAVDDEGEFIEPDDEVRELAAKTLRNIEVRVERFEFVEKLFFGISLGSVLVLAAIGLAITFGVMGVINMAHGELIMLGAYTTYVVQLLMPNHIEFSLFVAIPAAFLVSGLAGVAIERGVIRFLYGRPLETLLATFGISLILQQTVRSIFSPLNRAVSTPEWMSGSWEINSALALTYNRLYIVIFTLMVFFALMLILRKTSLGLQVRAVSQNRTMARAMGIRTGWVDAMTFGLGSGIAGVAGVALSQLTNVGPNLGQSYIIDSFIVVVFGGVGNLWGTLVGGLSLGVANKFLEPWAGAMLAKILVLVFIILFIQKYPRGLFPQKGRAAEN